MNTSRFAAFYLCTFLLCATAHANSSDDYAYAWPLQTTGDSSAWQVELTPEVYAAIGTPDLRDVEVVNAAGEPVPMAPHAAQTTSTAQANDVALPQFALPAPAPGAATDEPLSLHIERGADGRLRRLDAEVGAGTNPSPVVSAATGDLLLDASALHAPIDSLWLDWDEADTAVNAQFSVAGSDDLQQWRTLNASATVLSLRQEGNVLVRRQIALSSTQAKYLRLHRLDNTAALDNLHVRARTLMHANLTQPSRLWLDAEPEAATPATVNVPAAFRYRLPAPLAIDALKLELASDNSLARVRIASRLRAGENANGWQTRAEFTAFRLRQGDSVIGNDEQSTVSGGRAQEWQVEPATPMDHAPILRVAFRPDRFVFLAQGSGPYRLVAGSARARRGDYPVDTALAQLRTKLGNDWQPPLATLGARATLHGESALAPLPVQRDWKTWLLWAVLAGAAALIGGLALSLLRSPNSSNQ
jgi:hypothetical protein